MSQENVDRIQGVYDYGLRTGEIQPEALHPEFVWDMRTFRGALLGGTYEGVDGTNRFLAEWLEGFEDWSLDIEEVFDAGDRVVTVARQVRKARRGGAEVETTFALKMRFAQVWTFRDGLAVRMEMYASRDEALEAAGLRE